METKMSCSSAAGAGGGQIILCLTPPPLSGTFVLNPNHKTTQDSTPRLQGDTTGILTNPLRAYFPVLNNVVLWAPVSFYSGLLIAPGVSSVQISIS